MTGNKQVCCTYGKQVWVVTADAQVGGDVGGRVRRRVLGVRQKLHGRRVAGAVRLAVEAAVRQQRRRVDLVDGSDQRRTPAENTLDVRDSPALRRRSHVVQPTAVIAKAIGGATAAALWARLTGDQAHSRVCQGGKTPNPPRIWYAQRLTP